MRGTLHYNHMLFFSYIVTQLFLIVPQLYVFRDFRHFISSFTRLPP